MRQAKSIGSILVDVELVTQDDIEKALELQKQTGKRLGEVLVMMGAVSDDDIRWALAEQLNLPYVNIRKDQIDPDVAQLLPEKIARRYHVIPILKIENELTVVVDDPLNTTIIKDIEKMTKSEVKISLGRISDILLAIDEIYGTVEEQEIPEQQPPPKFVSSWFHEEDMQKILNDPSGHVLMERIVTTALDHGISRIYFQPGSDLCHVSYRVNGVLQEQIQLSLEWYSILLFRLKISADFEIPETSLPQYREFFYKEHLSTSSAYPAGEPVVFALSILPTTTGESAVLSVVKKSIEHLWLQEDEEKGSLLQKQELLVVRQLQTKLQHCSYGAVFLGGRGYLEKMTTLYGLLRTFDPIQKKIVIFEAHSEYLADKCYQVRYGREDLIKLHHALHLAQTATSGPEQQEQQEAQPEDSAQQKFSGLRQDYPIPGFQRVTQILQPEQCVLSNWLSGLNAHDPDVLLIDHIASEVVLAQSLDFAANGVMFASLELPTAFLMLAYMLECQTKPSVIASRVLALMAQYSLRVLCQECKQKDDSELGKQMMDRLQPTGENTVPEIYKAVGCPACNRSGYVDQITLFEILPMESWLKELLLAGAPLAEIRQTACNTGFHSLEKKGSALLFSGQTSLEEVFSLLSY
ncbi:type IV pilus assembly protein PilB [Candidatus Vecturithrix granuli]|uniref:Type IV pilus assembly protein PilB n=1 Tax=Vecturithrix granuli TaxID=1499967 RepID=A0A0S6W6M4_VECG1|nr:type IV pilus assembly protein PilB [Candidatus Vecturithrix granuli]